MSNLSDTIVTCSNTSELIAAANAIVDRLGGSLGRRFGRTIGKYLSADFDNAHLQLNGRSVAEILQSDANDRSEVSDNTVVQGEVDGYRFSVTKPPHERLNSCD
ncbi:hypothetical protein [Anatilimnocola floriformis]|uniref:hypothetical protein n=1 Tax=Anatilimnocola floriformis TaxID=2948575 RepID=UPI0020C4B511|nr:hypothetical protein [Anatilimnocola floriformis]